MPLSQKDLASIVDKLADAVDDINKVKADANKPKPTQPAKPEPEKEKEKAKEKEPEPNFFGGQDGFNSQDAGYIILCCYVVFTMQSGFALLESGTIFQKIVCSLPGTLL